MHLILVATPEWQARQGFDSQSTTTIENCFSFIPLVDQAVVMRRASQTRVIEYRRDILSNDPDFILHFARAGKGCALVPDILVREEVLAGSLVNLLPKWSGPTSPVHLVFPIQQKLPKQLKAFADFLVAQAQALRR